MEKIVSERLKQQYVKIRHASGLTMLLCPMEGFSTTYAMLGAPYGSVDVCFKTGKDPDFVTVPEGIAHFLEHKLFENEDCDAFERYARTGASANAYTSFDRTCYLFECGDNFRESLEILLDFVTHPYFTDETVAKEQGIIGQEIRMYEDSPDWRVQFNMLRAMYHVNPVRNDIAGTIDSISQIDAGLLYRCYHTFYNLSQMVLAIAGRFTVEDVLSVAGNVLTAAEPVEIEYRRAGEPESVCQRIITQKLEVSTPMFYIGFKASPGSFAENAKNSILDEMIVEILCGEASPLYRKLYDSSLINAGFYGESMASRDYICSMFCGESKDPRAVFDAVCEQARRLAEDGIDEDLFRVAKATIYGRYIGAFDTTEGVAGLLISGAFCGLPMYDLVDTAAGVTREMLVERVQQSFRPDRAVLSIVEPVR